MYVMNWIRDVYDCCDAYLEWEDMAEQKDAKFTLCHGVQAFESNIPRFLAPKPSKAAALFQRREIHRKMINEISYVDRR